MTSETGDVSRFARWTALAVSLTVGEVYAIVLFASVWAEGTLGWAFVATTELYVVAIAGAAAVLFGFVVRRSWLTNAFGTALGGFVSVAVGRIVASFLLFGVTGVIALSKRPDAVADYVGVLVPGALGFAVLTAILTLFVPEALGIVSGLAILGIVRGRFAGSRQRG